MDAERHLSLNCPSEKEGYKGLAGEVGKCCLTLQRLYPLFQNREACLVSWVGLPSPRTPCVTGICLKMGLKMLKSQNQEL